MVITNTEVKNYLEKTITLNEEYLKVHEKIMDRNEAQNIKNNIAMRRYLMDLIDATENIKLRINKLDNDYIIAKNIIDEELNIIKFSEVVI